MDPSAHPSSARQLRILVVDDNVDVADPLATLLGHEGHEIRTEYSGAAGLATAEEFKPHVVFCDIGMPGMDGHQVAARVAVGQMLRVNLVGGRHRLGK